MGVLAIKAMNFHQALLFRQLSDDVTVFLHFGLVTANLPARVPLACHKHRFAEVLGGDARSIETALSSNDTYVAVPNCPLEPPLNAFLNRVPQVRILPGAR